MQIRLFAEIPTDVVTTRCGGTAHLGQSVFFLLAQETDFDRPNVVGQPNHGTQIVGGHQMVGDNDRPRNALKEALGMELLKQVVGF